jgi:hypothetical protein
VEAAPITPLIHSITSSAMARSEGKMMSTSALAVLRLITSTNLVGCTSAQTTLQIRDISTDCENALASFGPASYRKISR